MNEGVTKKISVILQGEDQHTDLRAFWLFLKQELTFRKILFFLMLLVLIANLGPLAHLIFHPDVSYFDKEHVHLEDMIKKFDRPMAIHFDPKHDSYSHRLEYLERSIQILRDMQTAIYERETEIAQKQLELHDKYKQSGSCNCDD